MRRRRLLAPALLCLALGAATAPTGAQPRPASRATGGGGATRAAIVARNAAFGRAFGAGDPAAVAALYTSDAQLLPPNMAPIAGRDGIAGFWKGALDAGLRGARLETQELQAAGDVATELGHYTLTTGDGTVADEGKYVVVWHRVHGTWQLHRDIWNSSRPAPAAR